MLITKRMTVWSLISQESFQIGQGIGQGCILSPLYFKIYGEWIIR